MTKVERRGVIFSLICSLFFSVGFIIGSMYIKFNTNEMPKEIFIYLNPDEPLIKEKEKAKTVTEAEFAEEETSVPEPSVEAVQEQPAKSEEAVSSAPPEPVKTEQKTATKNDTAPSKKESPSKKDTVPSPKQPAKAEPKTQSKAASNTPAAPKNEKAAPKEEVVPVIKKSVEELMAEQNAKKPKKEVDWDKMFDDDEPEAKSTSSSPVKTVPKSSLEGTAASQNKTSSDKAVSTAQEKTPQVSASSNTMNALANIKPRSFSTTVSDTTKSRATLDVSESNGKYSVKFSGGVTRELLRPKNPTLYVSEENASLVQITANVKITFTVLANGTVPVGNISFSPSALLPFKIQDELKEQIASWQFSAGSSSSTATFDYTLEVR